MANSRDKGKRGERLVIDWLQPIVDEICQKINHAPIILQRNTIQSDKGGTDIVGIDWMAAEVKNAEQQNPAALLEWWIQCVSQAIAWSSPRRPLTPVLFYKKAGVQLRVRMFGHVGWTADYMGERYTQLVNCGHTCQVDIDKADFEIYFRNRMLYELQKK